MSDLLSPAGDVPALDLPDPNGRRRLLLRLFNGQKTDFAEEYAFGFYVFLSSFFAEMAHERLLGV